MKTCNVTMSRLRGQTYKSALHYFLQWARHQHTKDADCSRYQSIYEPTEPSQPMMSDDVSDEYRPQHRELRPLLLFDLHVQANMTS